MVLALTSLSREMMSYTRRLAAKPSSFSQTTSDFEHPSVERAEALIATWMSRRLGFILAPSLVISTLISKMGASMKRKVESERGEMRVLRMSSEALVQSSTAL